MYANVRSVWRDYIIKTITTARNTKAQLKIFVNKHQGNTLPIEHQINETTVKLDLDWNNDWIHIDEKTLIITGEISKESFKFSGIDILQITELEKVQIQIDPKLLQNSKKHLKFEWIREK